jgi:hypothetical protein
MFWAVDLRPVSKIKNLIHSEKMAEPEHGATIPGTVAGATLVAGTTLVAGGMAFCNKMVTDICHWAECNSNPMFMIQTEWHTAGYDDCFRSMCIQAGADGRWQVTSLPLRYVPLSKLKSAENPSAVRPEPWTPQIGKERGSLRR